MGKKTLRLRDFAGVDRYFEVDTVASVSEDSVSLMPAELVVEKDSLINLVAYLKSR